jgi:hypothetical protein
MQMQIIWGAIKKIKKVRPLPDNLGSRFLANNLILTQLDEICTQKLGCHHQKMGCHQLKFKK